MSHYDSSISTLSKINKNQSVSAYRNRSRQTTASLANKLLSSISPDAEACQNNNQAVMRLYLQQIRALEDTIWTRELQNDSLRQELANLQDKLQSSTRKLSRAERQADKLQMHLEMLKMMGTHHGCSSQHCYVWTSLIRRYIGLHHFFSHSPTPKPMYDTI